MAGRGPVVALVGNPNSGKTALFNALTGSSQHVGNWPGVTVDLAEGAIAPRRAPRLRVGCRPGGLSAGALEGAEARVVDLPGIYSLSAAAQDEAIALRVLLSEPDLVVNVVDATALQRNLFLTLQLLEMRIPVVVVLTMMDLAARRRLAVDPQRLARDLGCPVIPHDCRRPDAASVVASALLEALGRRPVSPLCIAYDPRIEAQAAAWAPRLAGTAALCGAEARWAALRLLEGDGEIARRAAAAGGPDAAEQIAARSAIAAAAGEEPDVLLADARYDMVHRLSRAACALPPRAAAAVERADGILLNRFFALPLFLAAMYLVFWFTMSVGGAFVDFFDLTGGLLLVQVPGVLLERAAAPAWLEALAAGLGAGLQTVATFVPVILALFVALALLEDSGYMARAAFVMDRLMRLVGLPGRAFVPMMVGFGCTVPAILATRSLDCRRDRIAAVFMVPSMSCGARLPVYALFAAAFFPGASAAVVFSLYLVGIVAAALTGLLLRSTLLRGPTFPFVMELPPYHAPRLGALFRQAWLRLQAFVLRAGASIVLIVAALSILDASGGDDETLLAAAGRAVAPVFAPMGMESDNWPAAVGLITGVFAKEAVVGTLSSLYGRQAAEQGGAAGLDVGAGLREAARTVPANLAAAAARLADPLGAAAGGAGAEADPLLFARLRAHFSPAAAYAYLLFVLLYLPCVAALGAAVREIGAGYGALLALTLTTVAWSVATLFYQLAEGHDAAMTAAAATALALLAALLAALGRGSRRCAGARS